MAGEAYLKVAASNIRRAVLDKQSEIKALNDEMNTRRNDIEKDIQHLDRDIHLKNLQVSNPEIDNNQRQQQFKQAQQEKLEISDKRRAITEVHNQIKQRIAAVESQMRDLESKASELERSV